MFTRSRLSRIPEEQLNAEQHEVLNEILRGPRGNLDGPFLAWIHSPKFADHAQRLGAFCRYDTSLETRLSELAILTTAALWQSQAEWMIHEPIGLKSGLTEEVLSQIRNGESPRFLKTDEGLIYRFVTDLYTRRRVGDDLYCEAVELLGEAGVVELTGILGYYSLVAMTLNVFAVAPDDKCSELPFPA
ncbi:carboxymuconolactone decarboxylase family protein [Pseudomonas sp. PWP3-1b2]|uniref:carboxymuconolactone decarboxylase family protein n=1 Tax=Pseudomonas sp. PWP3-1b2 TaxID=2804656 RepID=UPI003CEC49C9